jgi:hypothetical protein
LNHISLDLRIRAPIPSVFSRARRLANALEAHAVYALSSVIWIMLYGVTV